MGEDAGGFAVKVIHVAAEGFQLSPTGDASGSRDRIQDHPESAGTDHLGIDESGRLLDVSIRCVLTVRDRAAGGSFGPVDPILPEAGDDSVRDGCGGGQAIGVEALEAVPLDRVVTGGGVDSAITAEVPDHHPHRRSGGDSE